MDVNGMSAILSVAAGGIGSVIGGFIGGWTAARQAVNKKWDAETRAEMHNALTEGIQAHEARCLLQRAKVTP